MLTRYLGNKTDLLEPIMTAAARHCPPASTICDIFSGTLSVGLEFKRRGYNVLANDINLFSAIIGDAFLVNNALPNAEPSQLVTRRSVEHLRSEAHAWADHLAGRPGYRFLTNHQLRRRYESLLVLILHLQHLSSQDLPSDECGSYFFDTYTEEGGCSDFVSQRGRKGRRRFFSPANGKHIERMLGQIRIWRRESLIDQTLYATLLCSLLRAVEKVSNTQGTYHDFPREQIDPRALRPLRLEAPAFDTALMGGRHQIGRQEDSLEYISTAPSHDLLYIDPPYNFRQYTSYYFMHNVICRYADIDDLDDYFDQVRFVRGQNMVDDFNSSFCSKSSFISSLRRLIERAKTRFVVLSYFDGRNHWNDFKSDTNGVGHAMLLQLFSSRLFRPGSLTVLPIRKVNYQSYGGYKAKEVVEFLFVAEKA